MALPFVIAITGGAGAGKSAVARSFAARGAVILDADVYARRIVEERTVVDELVAAFGEGIIDDAGSVDRAALADAAFADAESVARLGAITHPPIAHAMLADLTALGAGEDASAFAVLDVPLLTAVPDLLALCDAVIAVEAPDEVRVRRLVSRGLAGADSRRRIALQPGDGDRRAIATDVVVNDGSLSALEARTDALWRDLCERAADR